jgi:hypothetical protein
MSTEEALPEVDLKATKDSELARILDACLAEIAAGRRVDLERLAAENPSLAGRHRRQGHTARVRAAAGLVHGKLDHRQDA